MILIATTFCGRSQVQKCITDERQQEKLLNDDYRLNYEQIQREIRSRIESGAMERSQTVYLSVVFHDIYFSTPIVTDRVLSQLAQINNDFSLSSSDSNDIPAPFDEVASNTRIQFCLAQTDPDGNTTTGIVHYAMDDLSGVDFGDCWTSDYIDDRIKEQTIWDPEKYINIWIVDKVQGKFEGICIDGPIGYSSVPGEGEEDHDGVVIEWLTVGALDNPNPSGGQYGFGRTATHELGHFFGLYHIWGFAEEGVDECEDSDMVDDTPNQADVYLSCPAFPQTSCGSLDMFMNFMDYVDDDCYRMFTEGQRQRMWATLETQRSGLLVSSECSLPECDPTDSASFELYYYCDEGSWNVDAIALDLDPENHWWGLYESDPDGGTDDEDIVAGPFNIQGGLTANWEDLNPDKTYFVKHGIWKDNCYQWREKRIPLALVDFHYENKNGSPTVEFCISEDVFADIIETIESGNYLLKLYVLNAGNTYDLISAQVLGDITDPINITELFEDQTGNPDLFQAGTTYALEVLITDSACGQISLQKDFTFKESPISYHYENSNQEEQVEFCVGEDVFLDASESLDTGSYFMSLWRFENSTGDYSWIIGTDWINGDLNTPINITQTFVDLTGNPDLFDPGRTYAVKFSIIDPDCGQVWLQQDFRIIDCCTVGAPTNVQSFGTTLTWDPVPGATAYLVEAAPSWPMNCSCTFPVSIVPITTLSTQVTIPIGPNNCTAVQVRALCADGSTSLPSDTVCVRPGFNMINSPTSISISPNPNQGRMHIKVDTSPDVEKLSFVVYSLRGNLIDSFTSLKTDLGVVDFDLDLSSRLKQGVYFFVFQVGTETITKQVIVE